MAYNDRDYYRSDGGDTFQAKLARLMNYSFPLGTYLDTHVRVNIWFLVLPLFILLRTDDVWWTLRMTALWFFSVLLHEFGHVLGCRSVGGSANSILMWPLGGLAYVSPPRRPWAEFVTVACGPLVNVLIAAGCFISLFDMTGRPVVSLNPFAPYGAALDVSVGNIGWFLVDAFVVNYWLLLFNMALIFYPFDGGRIVQIILWKFTNYHTSMIYATRAGMVGAVLVALFGVVNQSLMLVFIGVFGFITCYRQGQYIKYEGIDPYTGVGVGEESWRYGGETPRRGAGWLARWRYARAAKRRARLQQLDAEVGRILAKVKDHGLQSLTRREKRLLQQETERLRSAG